MSNRTKKEFILDGLCCANCAAKIERGINDINGVKNVSLNFMSKKLTIEINEKDDLNRVMEEAADIVKRIEPDVKMIAHQNDKNTHSHEHHHDHSHGDDSKDNKGELLKLAIGAALFLGAVTLNLSYNIELALFIISYILVF